MELDTGAAVSVISTQTKSEMFPQTKLMGSTLIMTTYTGEKWQDKYRTLGFIHDTLFSWFSRKLRDSWKFNSWTAISLVKCIMSYWTNEESSWKFKCELSACYQFVKISHRETYPAYGIGWDQVCMVSKFNSCYCMLSREVVLAWWVEIGLITLNWIGRVWTWLHSQGKLLTGRNKL